MRLRALILPTAAALALGSAATAQEVLTSAAPQNVGVTIYRAPERPVGQAMNLRWLNGFALITETRQVSIPAGDSVIRFEGVAGGILPQSAIVSGFPEGVVERNQDAYLLSPASLLDRSLGQRVHLRRTSPSGEVREHEAVIRSGASGAVVLQTQDGFEALRCSGLPETPVYSGVPQGLSAQPTLSVRVRSAQPVTATVQLSYLATGFDWQANYVATLAPDGDTLDLFAWVTLASTDETSFPDAEMQAVAGRLNRTGNAQRTPRQDPQLRLQCWPQGRTSDLPEEYGESREEIVVTGSRVSRAAPMAVMAPPPPPPPAPVAAVSAQQEELGDLKLYRFPERVTVAANSQKQVAFLTRQNVRMNLLYRSAIQIAPSDEEPVASTRLLVTRNRAAEGLGIPLPAGRLVLFASGRERPILIGEGTVADRAVDEDVEVQLGASTGVVARTRLVARTRRGSDYEVIVTNDQPQPVRYQAELMGDEAQFRPRSRLGRRNGRPLWSTEVPANGTARLRYRVLPPPTG